MNKGDLIGDTKPSWVDTRPSFETMDKETLSS